MDSWKVCLAIWKVQSWTFQLARQLVRTKRLITASGFEQKVFKSTSRKYRSNLKDTHTDNKQFGYIYGAHQKNLGAVSSLYRQWCVARGVLAVQYWRSSRRGTNGTWQIIKSLINSRLEPGLSRFQVEIVSAFGIGAKPIPRSKRVSVLWNWL